QTCDQSRRRVVAVQVVERVEAEELTPRQKLRQCHRRLPFLDGSSAKGKGKDVPEPVLTLGAQPFPRSPVSLEPSTMNLQISGLRVVGMFIASSTVISAEPSSLQRWSAMNCAWSFCMAFAESSSYFPARRACAAPSKAISVGVAAL